MRDWIRKLKFNPIEPLASSRNEAIQYFVSRDLLEGNGTSERLWNLPQATRLVSKQQSDGSWKYPGGGKQYIRSVEEYNQIETYRNLGELVEKFGFIKNHPAIERAADFLFSHQTTEGDFRGIYGTQYSPNYSAAIMELLIKAGYEEDLRVEKGFQWLISTRQDDGGWAIPVRTASINFNTGILQKATIQPVKKKPFSHLVTGVVLRAFAAHKKYSKSKDALRAGELLASRFFKKDMYIDRGGVEYWFKFSYPFWFTDILSSLDSLSKLRFNAEHFPIKEALGWFTSQQLQSGAWKLKLVRGKDKDLDKWVSLAICRVFKRFYDA